MTVTVTVTVPVTPQAKAISELLMDLLVQCYINIFIEPFFYIVLFILGAAGGIWLGRMQSALGMYDPAFIIPLLQSNYILCATISGGVYFQEFKAMDGEPWRCPN